MSAELPTEEDVLAALLILWLEGQGDLHDSPDDERGVPTGIGWLAWDRSERRRVVSPATIEAAIADSERRLEVESAKEWLLWAVLDWSDSSFLEAYSEDTRKAVIRLRRALEGK